MAAKAEKPTNEELIERLHAAGDGTPEATEILADLWENNIKLVRWIVRNLTGLNAGDADFEDMEQQAYLGFHAAAYSFNLSGPTKFTTYVVQSIRWELCRYYERGGSTIHVPAYMKTRLRRAAKKRRELEAEAGHTVTMEVALQSMGLSPDSIAGTLATFRKLEMVSLDAKTHEDGDSSGISPLDVLADGVDVEMNVIEQVWQQELHRLLFKALRDVPEGARAAIVRRYFADVSMKQIARESGISKQAAYEREQKAFRVIRAGKYGPALTEFCSTENSKARAERLIKREVQKVNKLQLSEDERGLLAL